MSQMGLGRVIKVGREHSSQVRPLWLGLCCKSRRARDFPAQQETIAIAYAIALPKSPTRYSPQIEHQCKRLLNRSLDKQTSRR